MSKVCLAYSSMRYISVMFVFLLGACATPQERAESVANYINVNYGPLCEKLGYAPGSDPYRNCMLSMYNADQAGYASGWARPMGRRW